MKILTNGKIITEGKILTGLDICIEDGKIVKLCPSCEMSGEKTDLGGNYISPGFIEMHCHGGDAAEFIDATAESMKKAAAIHAAHGTRVLFPTISSTDYDTMVRVMECFREVKDDCALEMPGVHFEGPYFAPEMCGGQAGFILRDPKPEEYSVLLEKYADMIARWDYAPEKDQDNTFLCALNEAGVIPGTAHSAAEYTDMVRAFEEGNRIVTHLYSCTSTIVRHQGFRHLGIIESAYLMDDMFVEAIADGRHLPLELLRMIVKIKGVDRVCLVTDAIRHGGAGKDQEGKLFADRAVPYLIEDGVAKLPDRSAFAGSIATSDILLRTAVEAGIALADAVKMMTQTPAAAMRLKTKGKIAEGYDAQFTVFDEDLNVVNMEL